LLWSSSLAGFVMLIAVLLAFVSQALPPAHGKAYEK
jgi:hypothetical protein